MEFRSKLKKALETSRSGNGNDRASNGETPSYASSSLSRSDRRIHRGDQVERFQGEHRVPLRRVHDGLGPLELHVLSELPADPARAAAFPDRLLLIVHGAYSALSQARREDLHRCSKSHPCGFRIRRPDGRRRRTVEADVRGPLRHSLVEDAVYSRRLSGGDRLRIAKHGSAFIRLVRVMPGRANRAPWSV